MKTTTQENLDSLKEEVLYTENLPFTFKGQKELLYKKRIEWEKQNDAYKRIFPAQCHICGQFFTPNGVKLHCYRMHYHKAKTYKDTLEARISYQKTKKYFTTNLKRWLGKELKFEKINHAKFTDKMTLATIGFGRDHMIYVLIPLDVFDEVK